MKRQNFQNFQTVLLSLGLALVSNAGCHDLNSYTPQAGEDPISGTSTPPDDGCPPEACGFNGPRLADALFGELDLDGRPNARGMSVVDFLAPGGRSLALDIRDSRFVGLDPSSGTLELAGAHTPGSGIVVRQEDSRGSSAEWILWIEDITEVDYLSDQPGSIPGYRLSYAPVSEPPAGPSIEPSRRLPLCPHSGSAVIISGERYDERTLAIQPDDDARFFRLACADDHMLGKARRMSYDAGFSSDHPYATTAAERRATLAMLAADYCGTGERFTRPGVPLYWQNRAAWMVAGAPPEGAGRVEAAWNEDGATCLDEPRLAEHARADIEAACGRPIPRCTADIMAASEWLTLTP